LRSQEQASADQDTRIVESVARNNQIPSLHTLEDNLLTEYLNPEPGDLVWNLVCQEPKSEEYTSAIGDASSSGLTIGFDWNNPIETADTLFPITFSTGIHSPALPEIEYPPAQLLDSIAPSEIFRSIAHTSSPKGSGSSRLSSPEPCQPHERLMPSSEHPCRWATCLEAFDQASKFRRVIPIFPSIHIANIVIFRTHVRIHTSLRAGCMWTGCFKFLNSTPDLK
jgi:hypothetical protein